MPVTLQHKTLRDAVVRQKWNGQLTPLTNKDYPDNFTQTYAEAAQRQAVLHTRYPAQVYIVIRL
jgi:hypothetical protein